MLGALLIAALTPAIAGAAGMQRPDRAIPATAGKTGVEQVAATGESCPTRAADIAQVSQTSPVARRSIPDAAPIGGRDRCDPAARGPVAREVVCRAGPHAPPAAARQMPEASLAKKGQVSSLVETLADETGRASQDIDDTAGAIAILGFPAGADAPARR